jgi:hypothetical protein
MIQLTALLSSLTAFIVPDSERLDLSCAEVKIPGAPPCPLEGLSFIRSVDPARILQRLADLSGLPADRIAPNLAAISPTSPYFILVEHGAAISLPPSLYDRIQTVIQRIGTSGSISFTIQTLDSIAAVPTLQNTNLPDPIALLFLLEHEILCQPAPHLEIGISPGLPPYLAAPISSSRSFSLQPCG